MIFFVFYRERECMIIYILYIELQFPRPLCKRSQTPYFDFDFFIYLFFLKFFLLLLLFDLIGARSATHKFKHVGQSRSKSFKNKNKGPIFVNVQIRSTPFHFHQFDKKKKFSDLSYRKVNINMKWTHTQTVSFRITKIF